MKRRSLERLIALREHVERQARAALGEARRAFQLRERERDDLVARRDRAERTLTPSGTALSEDLRRRHDHLFKIGLELEALRSALAELEGEVSRRQENWLEARREVKSLRALAERREAERSRGERRRIQQLVDALSRRRLRVEEP